MIIYGIIQHPRLNKQNITDHSIEKEQTNRYYTTQASSQINQFKTTNTQEQDLKNKLTLLIKENEQIVNQNTLIVNELNILKGQFENLLVQHQTQEKQLKCKNNKQKQQDERIITLLHENENLIKVISNSEVNAQNIQNVQNQSLQIEIQNVEIQKRFHQSQQQYSIVQKENENLKKMMEQKSNNSAKQLTQLKDQIQNLQKMNDKLTNKKSDIDSIVKDQNQKILTLVATNDELNKLLLERQQQLGNFTEMLREQQLQFDHEFKKVDDMVQNETNDQKEQRIELTSTIQFQNGRLNNQQNKLDKIISEKLSIQQQLTKQSQNESILVENYSEIKKENQRLQYDITQLQDLIVKLQSNSQTEIQKLRQEWDGNQEAKKNIQCQKVDQEKQLNSQIKLNEELKTSHQGKDDKIKYLTHLLEDQNQLLIEKSLTKEEFHSKQIKIILDENQNLKEKLAQIRTLNLQQQQQIQLNSKSYEESQQQVYMQQEQISLQNQKRIYLFIKQNNITVDELMQILQQKENYQKESIMNENRSRRASNQDSPFKQLHLQNYYQFFDSQY